MVEATFTILIADYVTWNAPELKDKDYLKILVVGDDNFANALNRVLSSRGGKLGRPVLVERIENADSLESVHMLFVGDVSDDAFQKILDFSSDHGLLLLSSREQFIEDGGLIQFVHNDNRLKFIINRDHLKPHQIKISSKLLRLSQLKVSNG